MTDVDDVWVFRQLRENLATHRMNGSNLQVELYDHEIPEERESLYLASSIRITMNMGMHKDARAVCDKGSSAPVHELGLVSFLPPNVPIRMSWDTKHLKYLSCSFGEGHDGHEWLRGHGDIGHDRLRECLDLDGAETGQILKKLVRELIWEDFASSIACANLAELALVKAMRHLCAPKQCRSGGLSGWQLKKVNARIYENPGEVASLAELAGLCRISQRHLMRSYLAATGRTLGAAVREAQLTFARQMLRADDLSISEIARRTGFSNASNFASAFKRAEGVAPGEYRRAM